MSDDEVYTNPPVKQVVFQVKFPNLFYIENKVGDFQMEIMDRFPDSVLALQKVIFAGEVKKGDNFDSIPENGVRKIWKFTSKLGTELELQNDSLTLSSDHHVSYALGDPEKQFKDVMCFAVDRLLKTVPIPVFTRIGLRYVNHCPIMSASNRSFYTFYDSCLPLRRFPLSQATDAETVVVTNLDSGFGLIYKEKLVLGEHELILDMDAFHGQAKSSEYVGIADNLHVIISEQFWKTAKEPMRAYMRRPKAGGKGL